VDERLDGVAGDEDATAEPDCCQLTAVNELVREPSGDAEHTGSFRDGQGELRVGGVAHRCLLPPRVRDPLVRCPLSPDKFKKRQVHLVY